MIKRKNITLHGNMADIKSAYLTVMQNENNGIPPTQSVLRKLKKHALLHLIDRHGGLKKLRRELGLDNPYRQKAKGYWKQNNRIEDTAVKLSKKYGCKLNSKLLRNWGHFDLISAATKYRDGINNVLERLDIFSENRKKIGYWEDFKNVEELVRPLCVTLGRFPTQTELIEKGISPHILKYHGGSVSVANKMNVIYKTAIYASDGHEVGSYFEKQVDDILYQANIGHEIQPVLFEGQRLRGDFIIPGTQLVIECLGYLKRNGEPTSERSKEYLKKWRRKRKKYRLSNYVSIEVYYDDDLSEIPKKIYDHCSEFLIQPAKKISEKSNIGSCANHKWSKERLTQELRELHNKYDRSPTLAMVEKEIGGGARNAIKRHGGITIFLQELGLKLNKKRKSDYDSKDKVIEKLITLKRKLGHPPSQDEIIEYSGNDLHHAVHSFGGMNELYSEIGWPCRNHNGEFKDIDKVLNEVKNIIDLNPEKEITGLLIKSINGKLYNSINRYHKGMAAIMKLLD